MDSDKAMETIIRINKMRREEKERKQKEEEDAWRRENTYGGKCPHTVTDESLGMVFCVECGIVTEEQTFSQSGSGSYVFRRALTPRKKKAPKEKKVKAPKKK